jgi:hypothetical protein
MSDEPLEGVVETAKAPPPQGPHERRVPTWGAILIFVGTFFLIANLLPQDVGSSFLLMVGLTFLAAYYLGRRNVGFLIPGGIVSGLGLGVLLTSAVLPREYGGIVILCLGLGFIYIWASERDHLWSLIPGGILTVLGAVLVASEVYGAQTAQLLSRWWPLILVGIGLWILLRRVVRGVGGGTG